MNTQINYFINLINNKCPKWTNLSTEQNRKNSNMQYHTEPIHINPQHKIRVKSSGFRSKLENKDEKYNFYREKKNLSVIFWK